MGSSSLFSVFDTSSSPPSSLLIELELEGGITLVESSEEALSSCWFPPSSEGITTEPVLTESLSSSCSAILVGSTLGSASLSFPPSSEEITTDPVLTLSLSSSFSATLVVSTVDCSTLSFEVSPSTVGSTLSYLVFSSTVEGIFGRLRWEPSLLVWLGLGRVPLLAKNIISSINLSNLGNLLSRSLSIFFDNIIIF